MEYFKKIETLVIWTVIIVLAIAYGVLNNKVDAPTASQTVTASPVVTPEQENTIKEPQPAPAANSISYQGVEGRSAINLLKSNYRVETQSFGDLGEFVKSIDGIEPDTTHFWAFYVNGSISQVGADAYMTKETDLIEWKLEQIQ